MHIRPARPPDAEGIARVRIATWRSAYRGIVPQDHLDQLSLPLITEQFRELFKEEDPLIWVAEEGKQITGFVFGGPERGDCPEGGEVFAVYIGDDYQGQGIGTRLMAAISRALYQQGKTCLILWVLEENPYRKFYEHLGGTIKGKNIFTIDGVDLPLISYYWPDVTRLCSPGNSAEEVRQVAGPNRHPRRHI